MSRFHPDQIQRARRSVVAHDSALPSHVQRVSRIVQWLILRDSRPVAENPEGKLVRIPRAVFEANARPAWPRLHNLTLIPGGAA
ncbi:hypothetical protein [Paracoccus sp. IB05]|uniref:hypothetical protein n=1 Tax=Paracoccus sp. IB05 TaxID=2779367 RepID=UPI0018E78800|nr:hypothetical protein [Paracoccus sp. IB05]MBJ2150658.1 hypothetical protein [Paracoccus sp. IB05]